MPNGSPHDAVFADGVAYERFMGRWSRLTGQLFVDWLRIPPHARWLEVGCGTGAFTQIILSACNPSAVVAFDPSPEQVDFAGSQLTDHRVQLKVGDVAAIDASDGEFDVAAAALVLNFVPKQAQAITEMRRVVRCGGMVAAYVWDFAGRRNISQHLVDAVSELAPAKTAASTILNAQSTGPFALTRLFESAGLKMVETRYLEIVATFKDFNDYWASNTGFKSPAANLYNSLQANQIQLVQEQLRDTLPSDAHGQILVQARACAVRGTVPS
jgi:ubiquinone/menaquinone biosynthesis C-methylase UbiE